MEYKSDTENKLPNHDIEDDIDLIHVIKDLWGNRKRIINITLIFIVIGLIIAFGSPIEYTSTIVVKPILSSSESKVIGQIGGLAAMAGINLRDVSGTVEIHPLLYPKIIESYTCKELMQSSIFVEKLNSNVSFSKYYSEIYKPNILEYIKKFTFGLPSIILNSLTPNTKKSSYNGADFNRVSEEDLLMMELLEKQLKVYVDDEQGYVKLSATMPENIQAAQLVANAQEILQRKVIAHKVKKAKEDLSFIEERFNENKNAFEKAQDNLARYRDANKNVNTATAQKEAERLESEYELAFSVYSELAKRVETQKIKVKEKHPCVCSTSKCGNFN